MFMMISKHAIEAAIIHLRDPSVDELQG